MYVMYICVYTTCTCTLYVSLTVGSLGLDDSKYQLQVVVVAMTPLEQPHCHWQSTAQTSLDGEVLICV